MADAGPVLGGIGNRERRWLLIFLIIGSAYLGLLLIQQAVTILGGFSQIFLIVFLAWLFAFVISPVARFLDERLPLSRSLAVVIAYSLALVALGFVLFYTGAAITTEVTQVTDEFPQTALRIEETLAGYQSTLGLDRFQIDLVEFFRTSQAQVGNLAGAIFGQAQAIAGATLATLGALVLILILSLYMLMDSERILAKINRAVPRRFSDEMEILERSVARAFGGF
ncbi:MAG TPA: AI-2E family transporter, partial [Candidatus Limnocylindrales bacterium]|nr:AI-2E family transporter [Candidatus Limnocylindrales bacterium]